MADKVQRHEMLAVERREEVAHRYLMLGETQEQIAKALGMTQSNVSYTLKAIQEDWRDAATKKVTQHKNRHLALYRTLLKENYERYVETSNHEYKTRYLENIRKVMADMNKLLGLDKIKVEVAIGPEAHAQVCALLGLDPEPVDVSTPQA